MKPKRKIHLLNEYMERAAKAFGISLQRLKEDGMLLDWWYCVKENVPVEKAMEEFIHFKMENMKLAKKNEQTVGNPS